MVTVAVLFSALLSAAAVSQEKSRGTLILLLLTDLRNTELVVGRLLASLLTVLLSVVAVAPFFLLLALPGGVGFDAIAWVIAVTLASGLAAGSLGSTLSLWREKTFQSLALTALGLVLWLAVGEMIAAGVLGRSVAGMACEQAAACVSPWRAVAMAIDPSLEEGSEAMSQALPLTGWFVVNSTAGALLLNLLAVGMVRVWNPSREARPAQAPVETEESAAENGEQAPVVRKARGQQAEVHRAGGRAREVWDNPVLWREVRTWAYGKKVLVVKAVYLLIFLLCAFATTRAEQSGFRSGALPAAAGPMAPLLVVSLVLVNALAVTSLTGERDGKSLDLLLATDLSPRELIGGKLGGVWWNAREMIVLPLALCGWLWWTGVVGGWEFGLLVVCLLVLDLFAAVLGIHAAMIYASSRRAIGASIGSLLFLFLGVSTCMRMMLALSDTFDGQLAAFLGFIVGGGVALFAALGWRNPSSAMALASMVAPFATFYAIVSFLLGSYSLVGLATVGAFGFATAAMLVPALSEFDIEAGAAPVGDD